MYKNHLKMVWKLRRKETETYRYARFGRDPLFKHLYRRRRSPACDDYRCPSCTRPHGTYYYPTCDQAHYCRCACCPRRGSRAFDLPGLDCDPDRCPCNCYRRSTWNYRPTGSGPFTSGTAYARDGNASRGRAVLDVVDETGGPLSLRHGDWFAVSIESCAVVDDIIAMLAPDQRIHKVVVRWRDGDVEDLDDLIPMDEIRRFAKRLEVKNRKSVRWT